jgi:hypothetical protein
MKKILLAILVLWGAVASAQPGYTNINSRYKWLGGAFSALNIPAGGTAVKQTGQWVRSGMLFYDSTGVDSGLYVSHGTYWVKVGGAADLTATRVGFGSGANALTGSANFIYNSGSGFLGLGTSITPAATIHILKNAVNNASQSTANGIFLENATAAATSTDSLVSPPITQSVNTWRTISAGNHNVKFMTSVLANGGASTTASYRIRSSIDGGAWTNIFSLKQNGALSDILTINSATISGGSGLIIGPAVGSTHIWTSSSGIGVAYGPNALAARIAGTTLTSQYATAIGEGALSVNGTGVTGPNDSASYNTAVGYHSMFANTNGNGNTGVGMNSLLVNVSGIKNTSIGAGSMEANTTGSFNTGLGYDALLQNTTGTENVGVGWLGWSQNRTGSYNVGVGNSTGRSVVYGYGNVALGYNAMYTGFGTQEDTVRYSIALGTGVTTSKSYQMVLGNDSLTETKIYGLTSGVGTKAVRYDPTTKILYYTDTTTGSGSTPTLQQVMTAGSNLNIDNVIKTTGNHIFTIDSALSTVIRSVNGARNTYLQMDYNNFTAQVTQAVNPGNSNYLQIDTINGITFKAGINKFTVTGLQRNSALSSKKMLIIDTAAGVGVNGRFYYDDIPSGGGMTNPMTTTGDMIYSSSGTTPARLAAVAAGSYLRSAGTSTAPVWSTLILPNAATANRIPFATATNTWGESANFTWSGSTLSTTPASDNQNTLQINNAAGTAVLRIGSAPSFSTYTGMWGGTAAATLANSFFFSNGGQTIFNGGSSNQIYFRIANVSSPQSAMYISAASNVGINSDVDVAKLNVRSTTEQVRVEYDASNYVSNTVSSAGVLTIAPTGASVTVTKPLVLKGYTVATLPTGVIGMTAYVTDALAPTFLATVVGGGAVVTPVFYNGTNWVGH